MFETRYDRVRLLWESVPSSRHQHNDRVSLSCWRLANAVVIDVPGGSFMLHIKADETSGEGMGLIRLLRPHGKSDRLHHLIMDLTLLSLDVTAIHMSDVNKEVVVGMGPHSAILMPYSAVGYDPHHHPSYLRIDEKSAIGRILSRTITGLLKRLDEVTEEDAAVLATGLARFAEALIVAEGRAAPEIYRMHSIEAQIEQNLSDAAFGIADVERLAGAGRSTLYRHFAAEGGVQRYIRRRRVERAFIELALMEAQRGAVTFAATKWGFRSHSHFSSVFRERFGCRPSEIVGKALPETKLGTAQSEPHPGGMKDLETLARWLSDISRSQ